MKIITIPPRGFGSNTYLLTRDNQTAVVIDPSQPRVAEELAKRGLIAKYVLLTHCHYDHVGGVATLQKTGARVFCSEKEKPLVGTRADLFELFGAPRDPFTVDETLSDNQTVELCGITFKTLLTAGHTAGSASYLVEEKDGGRYLFTGDTLFSDSIGRTDFPTGDMGVMRESLKRLVELEGDMPVYAGHNEETTLEQERRYNPFLADLY
ncbi:MAG: MBL fold metallo-hydrolase [Clostridia bacterium]|nr:MBL fold metallo-hydrolase [Clostridia bacterium]